MRLKKTLVIYFVTRITAMSWKACNCLKTLMTESQFLGDSAVGAWWLKVFKQEGNIVLLKRHSYVFFPDTLERKCD